eukprot:gene450-655_t
MGLKDDVTQSAGAEAWDDSRRADSEPTTPLGEACANGKSADPELRIMRLEAEVEALKSERERVGDELLRAAVEKDAAVLEARSLKPRLDELAERAAAAEREKAAASAALAAQQAAAARADGLASQNRELADRAETLASDAAALEAVAARLRAEAEGMRDDLEHTRKLLRGCEAENDALKQDLKASRRQKTEILESQASEVEKMEDEMMRLKEAEVKAVAELAAYKAELQPTLRRACTERDELQLSQLTWERDRERFQQASAQLESLLQQVKEERDAQQAKAQAAEEEAAEAHREISRLQRNLQEVLHRREVLLAKPALASPDPAAIVDVQAQPFSVDEQKAATLIQALQRGRQARAQLEAKQRMEDKKKNSTIKLQAVARANRARRELEQRKIEVLKGEVESLTRTIRTYEEHEADATQAYQQLSDARAQFDASAGREDALRCERAELIRKNESLQNDIDHLRSSLTTSLRLHDNNPAAYPSAGPVRLSVSPGSQRAASENIIDCFPRRSPSVDDGRPLLSDHRLYSTPADSTGFEHRPETDQSNLDPVNPPSCATSSQRPDVAAIRQSEYRRCFSESNPVSVASAPPPYTSVRPTQSDTPPTFVRPYASLGNDPYQAAPHDMMPLDRIQRAAAAAFKELHAVSPEGALEGSKAVVSLLINAMSAGRGGAPFSPKSAAEYAAAAAYRGEGSPPISDRTQTARRSPHAATHNLQPRLPSTSPPTSIGFSSRREAPCADDPFARQRPAYAEPPHPSFKPGGSAGNTSPHPIHLRPYASEYANSYRQPSSYTSRESSIKSDPDQRSNTPSSRRAPMAQNPPASLARSFKTDIFAVGSRYSDADLRTDNRETDGLSRLEAHLGPRSSPWQQQTAGIAHSGDGHSEPLPMNHRKPPSPALLPVAVPANVELIYRTNEVVFVGADVSSPPALVSAHVIAGQINRSFLSNK